MKWFKILFGFSACCFVFALHAAELTLIYSGNLDGELEPCGCSDQGNFGGIKRRVSLLDDLRKQDQNLVAISSGGLIRAEGSSDRIKSNFILEGYKAFKYDAIGVQWPDLIYGSKYLSDYDLPWVVSNWNAHHLPQQNSESNFKMKQTIVRRLQHETLNIEFFSWLDPDKSPLRAMQGNHSLAHNDMESLTSSLKTAKAKQNLTVVSTTYTAEQIAKKLPLKYIDIVFIESAYEEFSKPKKNGDTLVLQAGSRGMRIAKLNLNIDKGVIKKWQHKIIAMPESMQDSPRMQQWYADYNAKVKQDYLRLSELKKQQQAGKSPYVGEEVCETCHAVQYKRWQASAHAEAFDDLESVGKSFDPECLICHTVGFNKKGGFIDFTVTANLMGVQCESCHGAARAHVESAGASSVANKGWPKPKICGQCHTQPHSPGFSLDKYWTKIAH